MTNNLKEIIDLVTKIVNGETNGYILVFDIRTGKKLGGGTNQSKSQIVALLEYEKYTILKNALD